MKRTDFLKLLGGLGIAITEIPAIAKAQIRVNNPKTIVFLLNGGLFYNDSDQFINSINRLNKNTYFNEIQSYKFLNTNFINHSDVLKFIPDSFLIKNSRVQISNSTLDFLNTKFDSLTQKIGFDDISSIEILLNKFKDNNQRTHVVELNSTDVGHYSNKQYQSQVSLQANLIAYVLKQLQNSGHWYVNPFKIIIANCLVRSNSDDNQEISHHYSNLEMQKTWAIQISNGKIDKKIDSGLTIRELIQHSLN